MTPPPPRPRRRRPYQQIVSDTIAAAKDDVPGGEVTVGPVTSDGELKGEQHSLRREIERQGFRAAVQIEVRHRDGTVTLSWGAWPREE